MYTRRASGHWWYGGNLLLLPAQTLSLSLSAARIGARPLFLPPFTRVRFYAQILSTQKEEEEASISSWAVWKTYSVMQVCLQSLLPRDLQKWFRWICVARAPHLLWKYSTGNGDTTAYIVIWRFGNLPFEKHWLVSFWCSPSVNRP